MSSEEFEELQNALQNALLNTGSVERFLRELAVLATHMAGDDTMSCGTALAQQGCRETVTACSGPLASEVHQAQHESGSGPGLDAVRHARPVNVHDVATAERWPRFCRRAASLGVRSCYAAPLVNDGKPAGSLVLYARRPRAFGTELARRTDKFAGHASGALALSLRMASCAEENDQLRSSLVSRAVIDQAIGVIMATKRCPQDEAFEVLRSASQNTNVKLRDLAARIVTQVSGEQPQPAAPFEDG